MKSLKMPISSHRHHLDSTYESPRTIEEGKVLVEIYALEVSVSQKLTECAVRS